TTASAVVTETALRIGANWENVIDNNGTLISASELNVSDGGIDLGTDTNGNYVATIADSGAGTINVSGSGAESAAVTLGIVNDSIGDTQLAFNTGQNLTTSSAVTFATVDTGQGANE